jgi:hypothetical protein
MSALHIVMSLVPGEIVLPVEGHVMSLLVPGAKANWNGLNIMAAAPADHRDYNT